MTLFPIKTDQPTDENKPSATPIKIPFLSGPALFESDSFVVEKIFLESEVARLKAIIEELAKENCRKNEVFKDLTAHLEKIELLNSELLNENSELRHHAETLLSENNELQKKLSDALEKLGEPKKNSTNSHIRPSGDITRKPKPQPENGEKRKKGGQPGHPRHERPPVDPDDIDFSYFYKPLEGQTCSCGEEMERAPESDQVQHQIDMIENPVINLEHRGLAYKCPSCGNIHLGTIPDEIVNQGLVAPKLAAFMGSLNLTGHCSIRNIQEILGHFHTTLSIGQISKTLFKLAKALNSPYLELLELLYRQRVLYVDETGWKENGKKIWTWGFNAKDFTVFVIGFRSADILVNVLGNDFQGVISCDYYSSYRSYFTKNPNATPSFCHGHIIRDFKFCQDHLDPETHQYGEKLLGIEKNLFELWHKFSEEPTEELFKALKECAEEFKTAALNAPDKPKPKALAQRFIDYPDGYFTFIDTPGVDPTNNLAERNFRFIALARLISQGSRSEQGRRARERLWTATVTCRRQKRSLFDYLTGALTAYCKGEAVPSLLPR